MACALTQGYSLAACSDGIGGIKNVYFIEKANVTGYTKAAGVITALTKAIGKRFWKYELKRNTAELMETEEKVAENGAVTYKQNLKIILNTNTTSLKEELQLLAKNELIAVVEDKNGLYWALGLTSGLDMIKGDRKWGIQGTDRSGFELEFVGEEPEFAPQVSDAVGDALETPGA